MLSDGGYGFSAGFDVARGGAGVLAARLAHDQLQRHFGLAQVGGGAMAQLVQVEPGVLVEQDARAVVAEAGPAGVPLRGR
ncbi:hypothetical protein ACQP25_06630 [Microtetraspora malaysiensis]|uniref:hypothetical protein n=1 Tax=Microtetraspora malaysiensis TaxID=161358 RepID=UPI003D8B2EDC